MRCSRTSSVASTLKGSLDRKLSTVDLESYVCPSERVCGVDADWDAYSLPHNWARVKHPDSGIYYVNEDKVRPHCVCTSSALLTWHTPGCVHNVERARSKNTFLDHSGRRDTSTKLSIASTPRGPGGGFGPRCTTPHGGHEDLVLLRFSRGAACLLARRDRTRGGGYSVYVKQVYTVQGLEGALFVDIFWSRVYVANFIKGIEAQYW